MAEKHTVAMFVQGDDGRRIQVGWASPKDESGVRTFEYSPGFENTRPKDVSFEDDELSQEVAEDQHEARTGDGTDGEDFEIEVRPTHDDAPFGSNPGGTSGVQSSAVVENQAYTDNDPLPAEPVLDTPDESQAADPIDEQPDSEMADDPTDAGMYPEDETVELDNGGQIVEVDGEEEDEEAEFQRLLAEEEALKNQEQPQTRRELRENEDNN